MVLTAPPPGRTGGEHFHPAAVSGLPEPARRWLRHAIPPGAPLPAGTDLRMHGAILLGRWRPFRARETIVPRSGFTWAARTRIAGLPVSGFDRYADGEGEMRWSLAGIVPVRSARGFDVTLSAFERMVAESVFVPGALVDADWCVGGAPGSAVYSQRWNGHPHRTRVSVRVDAGDRLAAVSLWRWGDPTGTGRYGLHRFEALLEEEVPCPVGGPGDRSDILVPRCVRAAWIGADGARQEFFRAVIDAATPVAAIPVTATATADPVADP
ncbi:MAG: hypothetical protein EPN43_04775 [Jatrophihabitans sp.]|nr:MAG: hypothetical protein EPN43_04775 [Jatrophihabitans sp.]